MFTLLPNGDSIPIPGLSELFSGTEPFAIEGAEEWARLDASNKIQSLMIAPDKGGGQRSILREEGEQDDRVFELFGAVRGSRD